jgi:predicted nucleotidyltransferase
MVTKQIALETARAFVQECKAQGLPIHRAFMFGSYVHGTPHEGSDIDLLLVSKIFTDNIFTNLKTYAKINIRYPIIETHPVPLSALTDGNEFVEKITKEGVMID